MPARRTHGQTHSSEYSVWTAMKGRCLNPRNPAYPDYGGRGITVHPSWLGPGGFLAWLFWVGPRPSPTHTIGRIENNAGYVPGNVRWETPAQQGANTSRTRLITLRGETLHAAEWARRLGFSPRTLIWRVDRGWSEERILATAPHRSPPPKPTVRLRGLLRVFGVWVIKRPSALESNAGPVFLSLNSSLL